VSWSLWSLSPDRVHWMEVGSGMLKAEAEQAAVQRMDYARRHNFDGVFLALPEGRQPGFEHVPHPVTVTAPPPDVTPEDRKPEPEPAPQVDHAAEALRVLSQYAAGQRDRRLLPDHLAVAQVHATLALVDAVKALRWSP